MLSLGTNLNIKRRGQKSHIHIKHLFAFDNLHFLITERKNKRELLQPLFMHIKVLRQITSYINVCALLFSKGEKSCLK